MKNEYTRTRRHFALQIGSEKLKFSTPNKSFIKGLTNFALAGWLYADKAHNKSGQEYVHLKDGVL